MGKNRIKVLFGQSPLVHIINIRVVLFFMVFRSSNSEMLCSESTLRTCVLGECPEHYSLMLNT